jgi:hypothetical protein
VVFGDYELIAGKPTGMQWANSEAFPNNQDNLLAVAISIMGAVRG